MPEYSPNEHAGKMKDLEIGYNEVYMLIEKAKLKRHAAIVAFLFLTGMRVSEVVGGRLTNVLWRDIEMNKTYGNFHKVPKDRRQFVSKYVSERKLAPLQVSAWRHTEKLGQDFIMVTGPVLKQRSWPPLTAVRVIPVNDDEKPFIDIVEMYLKEKPFSDPMFKMSPRRVEQILIELTMKANGLEHYDMKSRKDIKQRNDFGNWFFPHLLRHRRHSILASEYFLDVPQLKSFSGWKDDHMPIYYARQNKFDIMTRMIRAKKGG